MTTYQVRVVEVVEYLVPVEFDHDFNEDEIKEAAVDLLCETHDRDKWCTAVHEREATEFIGTKGD